MSGDGTCVNIDAVWVGQLKKLELTLEAGTEEEAPAVNLDMLVGHLLEVQEQGWRQQRLHLQMRRAVKVSHVMESGSDEEADGEHGQAAVDSEAAATGAGAPVKDLLNVELEQEEVSERCAHKSEARSGATTSLLS